MGPMSQKIFSQQKRLKPNPKCIMCMYDPQREGRTARDLVFIINGHGVCDDEHHLDSAAVSNSITEAIVYLNNLRRRGW